jgi:hypothetical protein
MRILFSVSWLLLAGAVNAEPGLLTASGFGTVDPNAFSTRSQGRMMAVRAAQVDGQRQLAESIKGVELTGGTTVEDFEVTSDVVATRVRGLVQGAFILEESVQEEDNTLVAEVTMAVCLDQRPAVCAGRPTLENIVGESAGSSKKGDE